MNPHSIIRPLLVGTVLVLAACSSTSGSRAVDATTTNPSTSSTATTATTAIVAATSSTALVTTTTPPSTEPPAPTTAPRPPVTAPPVTAPPVTATPAPQVSGVRLRDYTGGVVCTVGTDITIVLSFSASHAAGVTVWSSTAGNIGQFPAESGEAEVPYTCNGSQTLFTLYPVAEGGGLGSPVDFYA